MPRAKKRLPTKLERQSAKADVKLLVFAGNTLADAARMRGVELTTAKWWSSQEKWMEQRAEQIKRVEELTKGFSPSLTGPQHVAFDLAKTNRESRSLLAMTANKVARHVAQKPPQEIYETASNFKQITEASAKIDGSWQDASANRFAIAINLAQIAAMPGQVREIPPDTDVVIEGEQ